jgi:hypothetical protein
MTNISKNQMDELKKVMEAELAQLISKTQDEMDPESKPSYIDVGGDGNAGDEAVADTLWILIMRLLGCTYRKPLI